MLRTRCGTALITGASSGIGAVYADRLARRGYDLILVARDGRKLNALARELSDETGQSVEVAVADLTDAEAIGKIENTLKSDASITLLVNNAGVGATAPLLASEVDRLQAMLALNVSASTRLIYAAVPGFVARQHGAIINIASIVAVLPELLNGVYGGSKAYLLALTRSLHHELVGTGVKVQAVLPGAVSTAFWGKAGTPVEDLPNGIVMSPEDMVDAALAGFDLGELVTIPSLPDLSAWEAFEASRASLGPDLSRSAPAARYGVA